MAHYKRLFLSCCQLNLKSIEKCFWIVKNIRIYRHECEGRIEKSVPRIAACHHEACRVMTNGDPEGRIFILPSHE